MSTTAGSSSMSTSIASAASRAWASVSATTAAIGSPTWRTTPSARIGWRGSCCFEPSRLVTCQAQWQAAGVLEVVAGEDAEHARHRRRRGGVEPGDPAVRHVRAQEVDIGLAGAVEVVGEAALAGQEAHVLAALERRADAMVLGHDVLPRVYSAATRPGFSSSAAAWIDFTMLW